MKALKYPRSARLVALGSLLVCSVARNDAAGHVVYQVTGTREQLQPVIDQFKHDIVYGPGGDEQHPPSVLGSFKVATFDDVNAGPTTTTVHGWLRSGGISLLSAFGPDFLVSAHVDDPRDPNRLFGDIDPGHATEFQSFSFPSSLAFQHTFTENDVADLFIGESFESPSLLNNPRNAFGAVFTGVDSPESAFFDGVQMDFDSLDPSRVVALHYDIPPAPPGQFSFLGVILDAGRMGGLFLRLPSLTDEAQDAVAVDDLILGVAPPIPEPSSILLLSGGLVAWVTFYLRRHRLEH